MSRELNGLVSSTQHYSGKWLFHKGTLSSLPPRSERRANACLQLKAISWIFRNFLEPAVAVLRNTHKGLFLRVSTLSIALTATLIRPFLNLVCSS